MGVETLASHWHIVNKNALRQLEELSELSCMLCCSTSGATFPGELDEH
jgi:hypothetical protein